MTERELGSCSARCVRCGDVATLTIREFRYSRGWTELLRPRFDAAVSRSATCSSCATTYPVRSTDRTAGGAGARGRRDEAQVPGARDWRHTEVQA